MKRNRISHLEMLVCLRRPVSAAAAARKEREEKKKKKKKRRKKRREEKERRGGGVFRLLLRAAAWRFRTERLRQRKRNNPERQLNTATPW